MAVRKKTDYRLSPPLHMICMVVAETAAERKEEGSMKRFLCLFIILVCIASAALADPRYVPADGGYVSYSSVWATSNQRIATRTGPGTQYDEPGSFYQAGTTVKVVSKAYDSSNGIWWVQVELTYNGSLYWVYTGVKRFDNLDLSRVPEETVIGHCRTPNYSLTGLYAPSESAASIGASIPAGTECDIYGYAYGEYSDFIQIEFYDSYRGCYRRAWVKDPFVDDYVNYYGF